jgi:hypothetical protein
LLNPRVGGAVTKFLVAPPGVLERVEVPEDLIGVHQVRIYREPGYIQAPLRRGADRAALSSPPAPPATRRSRGRTPLRTAYASSPQMPEVSAKRSEFLSFQPPAISDAEIEAVAETLRSGWLTTGPRTAELEARMRDYLEAKHVLAVSSGTAALHLSLVALGIGPGDEVITSSLNVARDRERDRPHRRNGRVRGHPRRHTQHRPRVGARTRQRADEGHPPR